MKHSVSLYSYYIGESRFTCTNNFTFNTDEIHDNLPYRHTISIGHLTSFGIRDVILWSVPGKVCFDKTDMVLRVWYDEPDRDAAIEAIGDYILDHISPTIREHPSFLKRLKQDELNAIKLLEDLTKD